MAKTTQSRVVDELQSCSDADKAKTLARFFKTGKGEYGEGDTFLGVVVPDIRRVAKKYYAAESLTSIGSLLRSRYHEVRLVALIMMVYKYQRAKNPEHRAEIFDFYISHTQYINNWDLVDLTAPNIVGDYLLKNSNVKALRQELRTQADPLWCTKCFRRKMTNTALSQRLIRLGRKLSLLSLVGKEGLSFGPGISLETRNLFSSLSKAKQFAFSCGQGGTRTLNPFGTSS